MCPPPPTNKSSKEKQIEECERYCEEKRRREEQFKNDLYSMVNNGLFTDNLEVWACADATYDYVDIVINKKVVAQGVPEYPIKCAKTKTIRDSTYTCEKTYDEYIAKCFRCNISVAIPVVKRKARLFSKEEIYCFDTDVEIAAIFYDGQDIVAMVKETLVTKRSEIRRFKTMMLSRGLNISSEFYDTSTTLHQKKVYFRD